jgi:ribosomal protein L37AE/L43A
MNNIGVAAHISGAAPGGPRYDASMSSEARKSINNGIWLCANCARLVDGDAVSQRVSRAMFEENLTNKLAERP